MRLVHVERVKEQLELHRAQKIEKARSYFSGRDKDEYNIQNTVKKSRKKKKQKSSQVQVLVEKKDSVLWNRLSHSRLFAVK